jgi:membrane protein YdbS with pleckstrin-like domain
MTKNRISTYKIIAITLFIIFSLLLIISLIFFISIIVGMNKYGGEMADGFGLISIFPYLIHLTVFLIWSFKIYTLQTLKKNTYFQLGLIFLLGLIMPYVIFARLDLIISLIF